jgi:polyisoprenoid-binding protein YceI
MNPIRSLAPIAALATFLFAADVGAGMSKTGDAAVKFHATGSAGMKFDGTTAELSVSDNGKVVRVTVALGNLETGIAVRNKHLKEKTLQVDKFPSATFAVVRGDLKFPDKGKSLDGEVTGTFNLHGVGKATKAKYTAKREGDTYSVSASFKVDITNHDIEQPSYLGVKVNTEVACEVTFQLKE